MIVTEEDFPHGVRCHNCHREIPPGEQYRNRKVSPEVDGVFCVTCNVEIIWPPVKCPHCEDRHACHRVDGRDPGQLLYETLYALYNLGKIGTTVFPWDQLSPMEQDEWKKIAAE